MQLWTPAQYQKFLERGGPDYDVPSFIPDPTVPSGTTPSPQRKQSTKKGKSTKKSRSKRGRPRTRPLTAEESEWLTKHFEDNLPDDVDIAEFARRMGVNPSTVYRLKQGGGSKKTRRLFALTFSKLHSANVSFKAFLKEHFNLEDHLLPKDTHAGN